MPTDLWRAPKSGAEGDKTKVEISQAKGQSWWITAGSVFYFQSRRFYFEIFPLGGGKSSETGGIHMLTDVLNQIDSIVWGPWLLVLLVGTGVYLSIRLGFLQVMKLPRALKLIFFARNKGEGDIDSFKALCTALAATVGTGNIVGVATAIKLGNGNKIRTSKI